jgi:hypothetical protein
MVFLGIIFSYFSVEENSTKNVSELALLYRKMQANLMRSE